MELSIKFIVLLISCSTTCFIFENFMSLNFEKKHNGNYLAYFGICVLINVGINFFANTYLNYLWSFIFYLILTTLLYKGVGIYKLTLLLFILLLILETCIGFFLQIVFVTLDIDIQYLYYISVLCSTILMIIAYNPLQMLLSKSKKGSQIKHVFEYIILIVSFLEILNISRFIRKDLPSSFLYEMIFICIVISLFSIYCVFAIERKNQNVQLKHNLELLKLQQQLSNEYNAEKIKQYEQQMKINHDIKKHIHILEQLYQNNEIDSAKNYSKQLFQSLDFDTVSVGNKALKILITHFIGECKEVNVNFSYSIDTRITFGKIPDTDLITIFSNLFSNALAAAKLCDEPKIELAIFSKNCMIVIRLSNTYCHQLKTSSDSFLSTKPHHAGYGIQNIQEVVDRYEGLYDNHIENNIFTAQICLPKEE